MSNNQAPNEPFELADDFLSEETPEPVSRPPLTVPQRLTAIEHRQLVHGNDLKEIKGVLKDLVPQVKSLKSWSDWSKPILKGVAPVVLTAVAAQFPAAKHFVMGLLNAITIAN